MKTKACLGLIVIFFSIALTGNCAAYIFGLSPHYEAQDRKLVLAHLLRFTLETASPGDEVIIYDAMNRKPVTQFSVPQGSRLQNNAKFRATRLASAIAAYKSFLTIPSASDPTLVSAINLPEFLDLAGPQIRKPGQSVHVILIGSPFYLSTNNPAFNMNNAFPTDAQLSADQSVSVFGTAMRHGKLKGITVHYAYLRDNFINDFHRERIERFWALYLSEQGGGLATFAPDLALAINRAVTDRKEPIVTAALDRSTTKIEMLHIPVRSVVRQSPPETTTVSNRITVAALQTTPFPVQTEAGKIGIGIMWAAPVDCDLYVQTAPNSPELFFGQTTTPAGRYFHDYRGPNMNLDYEFVELRTTDLSQIRAWVNLYEGVAPNVSGVVCVQYQGLSYRGEFTLAATAGNKGQSRSQRNTSPHWTEINLARIVNRSNPR